MPLLLAYLKSVPPGHTHHLAKACYALENFVENLGPKVQPCLPELMECVLQPLRNASSPRAKELAVSALGAIATAAQASLLPYFPTIMEHLREFLVTGHEDLQPLQIQSLGKEGAPRQRSQCLGRADAHLVFTKISLRAVQVSSFLSKKAFPLY